MKSVRKINLRTVYLYFIYAVTKSFRSFSEKLSLALMKAKIIRFLTVLNIEDGINSKLHYSKKWQVLLQTDTRTNIRGTSMSTPTTVANAAPEERPNKTTAVAIATSK